MSLIYRLQTLGFLGLERLKQALLSYYQSWRFVAIHSAICRLKAWDVSHKVVSRHTIHSHQGHLSLRSTSIESWVC